MKNTALWLEQGYCTNQLKDASLQMKNVNLEISIPKTVSEYEICRFKLIVEEVKNEQQLLLGSTVLGEKIAEDSYQNVSFVEEDSVWYTHTNQLNALKKSDNESVQQMMRDGVLRENTSYQRDHMKLYGEYDIKIQVFRQGIHQSDFLSSESPPNFTYYEQKIETITVYVMVCKSSTNLKNTSELANTSVYGSLGHLGFFMVDLERFSEFIRNEVGSEPTNLVDLFTTTDLVDKCFEEGILIITWGIKPWHYYIHAMNSSVVYDEYIISGTYKIKKDIKELSVIPGDELLTWPTCLEQKWPIIRLEGDGEKVELSLCTWSGALGNELISMYILQRSEEKIEHIQPMINYSFI